MPLAAVVGRRLLQFSYASLDGINADYTMGKSDRESLIHHRSIYLVEDNRLLDFVIEYWEVKHGDNMTNYMRVI